MKSALTAALNCNATTVAPPTIGVQKLFLDPAAFPCIPYADVLDGLADPIEDEFESLQIPDFEIVGSAPTNIIFHGEELADYPLNPRRRRGGKESFPDGVAESLGKGKASYSASSNFINEAVIGSLPRGLQENERLRVFMNTPLSPTRSALQAMPQDSAASRTLDGQRLRRELMKDSVIVFVTAGYSGKRFIFEKAKEMGVRSVVLDGPDSWIRLLEEEGVVAKFLPIDFSDADTVFDRCLEAIQAASRSVGTIDGITTFCEMAVPLMSRLAERLGLPCNSPEAVDSARDKGLTREILEKAGLPTPLHFRIESEADIEPAAAHVGFPAVIKPVQGAASIGVMRVNNKEELHMAYKRVVSDMKRARIVAGALIEGEEGDEEPANASKWINLVLLLEEYLDGDEVDCDVLLYEGRAVYGAIADNWPTVEPYFNETGSNCPSLQPRAHQAELMELAVQSTLALGFRLGVFHVECKYTSRGARLIEVNCRMGGGPVRNINLLVWGVDLVEEHLMGCAGIPIMPLVAKRPLKQLAELTVNAKVSGVLKHDKFCEEWASHPDVLYARPLIEPGHKCVCVKDGLPTWVCELMVTKPTVHEAIKFIKEIDEKLEIPIE